MTFTALPRVAAWRHVTARDGFEVCSFESHDDGLVATGTTTAVEDGAAWVVDYEITLDDAGLTRSALLTSRGEGGSRSLRLEHDGDGVWRADGVVVPEVAGCLDVDLESSALTNAFPVRRLGLSPGEVIDAPAAYVRAADLSVGRLDQGYTRSDDGSGPGLSMSYAAPVFDFTAELRYDASGLVVDYPGLAVRAR